MSSDSEHRGLGHPEPVGLSGWAVESMPTAFLAVDADWRFTYVNARAEQLLSRRREDLIGQVLWQVFPAIRGTPTEAAYRQAVASGEPASLEDFYSVPLDAWLEIQILPRPEGLGIYFVDISERHRAAARAQLVTEVTEALTGTLDAEEAVARLAQLVVPALAEWCVVSLVDVEDLPHEPRTARRGLRDVGVWHTDPVLRPVAAAYASTRLDAMLDTAFLTQVLITGRPAVSRHSATDLIQAVLVPGAARDLLGQLAPESFLVLPLLGRGHTVGLLTLLNGAARGPITAEEVTAATDIAGRAGLALDNARLFAAQRDLATELQRSLLTPLPQPEHLQLAVRYTPAATGAQVGGDWYDAFTTREGSTFLVIGDVAGHDRAAAVAMAQVRNLLRGIAYAVGDSPAGVLTALDASLRDFEVATLATVVVATVEPSPEGAEPGARVLRWSNAGHPPPVLVDPDGSAQVLTRPTDLLLGLDPGIARLDHTHTLQPGATVVIYTDGLVERRSEDLGIGLERLRLTAERLADRGVEEFCDALLADLATDADDDVAVLVIRAQPDKNPRPAVAAPGAGSALAAPAGWSVSALLPPELRTPARSRALVARTCADADTDPDTTDTTVLLTSEVVTNAVLHGRSAVHLSIHATHCAVHVAVSDEQLPPPHPAGRRPRCARRPGVEHPGHVRHRLGGPGHRHGQDRLVRRQPVVSRRRSPVIASAEAPRWRLAVTVIGVWTSTSADHSQRRASCGSRRGMRGRWASLPGWPMLTTRMERQRPSSKNSASMPAASNPAIGPADSPAARTARMK